MRRYFLFFLVAASMFQQFSCINSPEDNRLDIQIISPYNCEYHLRLVGEDLKIQSKSVSYRKQGQELIADTIFLNADTTISSKMQAELRAFFLSIADTTMSLTARDAYYFRLSLNNKLLRQTSGYDRDVYYIIKKLRRYINNEIIQCSDFFRSIDSL
jgi:hypothetical protein